MSSPMEVEDINMPLNDAEMISESRNLCSILELPTEMMVKVFSYLPKKELLEVRTTCERFNEVSLASPLWRCLNIDESLTPNEAKTILTIGGLYCKKIKLKNRIDTDDLLACATKVTKNVEDIEIFNCKGSLTSQFLNSSILCNVITRLKRLRFLTIGFTRFRSRKFFEILPRKRSHVDPKYRDPIIYTGPVNVKQIRDLCISAFENNEGATIENNAIEIEEAFEHSGVGFIRGKIGENVYGVPSIIYDIDWS